jgi:hypothetical protein
MACGHHTRGFRYALPSGPAGVNDGASSVRAHITGLSVAHAAITSSQLKGPISLHGPQPGAPLPEQRLFDMTPISVAL